MEKSSLMLYLASMVALYGTAKIINIHVVMVQWTLVGAQHRLCRPRPPLVLAAIWYDLCHTTIESAHLEEKDELESGFKHFMIAHFHLWTYPKNVCLLASRFNICKRYLQV
jgi:hypothetical protein